ncbi:hypothetical protein [Streptomyces sp. B93]|uniref:hypothetical protein n=1 Tax=Streptomyces sp. B93 TaxID=2824875 RepID=UPI001B3717A7|nr:hypothetical protein [Streptomyces sp. B93]MBQ1090183.1 hypothetical protein [Streptomyces sp. B93]
MICPAVLSRAAAVRVLRVALLVGGLFVLGVLWGEQAQAAEGTPVVAPKAAEAVGAAEVVKAAESVVSGAGSAAPEVGPRSVTVVSPDAVSGLSELPEEPAVPELPELSELPEEPVRILPAAESESESGPGSGSRSGSEAASGAKDGGSSSAADAGAGSARPVSAVTGQFHGPHTRPVGPEAVVGAVGVPRGVEASHGRMADGAAPAPPHRHAPAGEGDGALGNRSAADSGSSRHGDAYAVTVERRAPVRLPPGAAAVVVADGTRERYRDIPLFPG